MDISTGYTLADVGRLGFSDPGITTIDNTTDGLLITSPNFTLSSVGLLTNLTSVVWPSVTINYTYNTQGDAGTIVANTSTGLVTFFANVGTWLTLLSVVVIILIIAAVIIVVNRFGTGTSTGTL